MPLIFRTCTPGINIFSLDQKAPNSREYDEVRQSVVILLGTLAKHLDKDDPKIKPIVAKLTETLSTPSQAVSQKTVIMFRKRRRY